MPSFDEVQLERLMRAATLLLYNNLNNEISTQNTNWGSGSGDLDDTQFWTALGRSNPGISAEQIEAGNFYPGHVPSLIDAPIDKYPNVSVMAYQADALPNADDWSEQYMAHLAVEIMCKALCDSDKPDQDADALAAQAVNMRTHRTLAAVHAVFMSDDARTFMKVVPRAQNAPNQVITNVFVRREE